MPKAGLTVTTKVGKLAQPYESHGKTFTEVTLEISWTTVGQSRADLREGQRCVG